MGGVFSKVLQRYRRARQIIEDRFKPVMEKRQPMLHARVTAALAHRLVKQIVGGGRPEFSHVTGAETPDRFGNELKLCDRHEIEPTHLFLAALRLGIERTDCFKRVTEEIEPHRHVQAGWKKIEDTAAYCIVARLTHGRGSDETIELKPFDHSLHANDIPGGDGKSMSGHKISRRHALEPGVHGRQYE